MGYKVTVLKKARIIELTKEGLPTSVIAERLDLRTAQVYWYQIHLGVRVVKHGRKKTQGRLKNDTR